MTGETSAEQARKKALNELGREYGVSPKSVKKALLRGVSLDHLGDFFEARDRLTVSVRQGPKLRDKAFSYLPTVNEMCWLYEVAQGDMEVFGRLVDKSHEEITTNLGDHGINSTIAYAVRLAVESYAQNPLDLDPTPQEDILHQIEEL